MIKFLISILIILITSSCKEIQIKQFFNNIDNIEKKIKKKISNEDNKELKKNNLEVKNNSIFYFVGDPYFIEGVKYIPEENYDYTEIGISTFYGKELHNVKTINNDKNKVTELLGRHKTLPIPSMVKITNLDNGLSINIKIVDRHNDNASLIQVSRKVAQLLGFYKDKYATVRVDILADASKQWKNVSISLNEPEFNETISSAPTDVVSITNIDDSGIQKVIQNINDIEPVELSYEETNEFKLFLKVYKINDYEEIKNIMEIFSGKFNYTSEKNELLYNIIIGPIEKSEINKVVSYFISKGYKETKIILN